jgi:Uma2 family endonuclease
MPMSTATRRPPGGASQAELDRLVADLLPRQGEWDAAGYLWLTDRTNRLVELADGHIEVLPLPTKKHQAILKYLFLAFHAFIEPRGGTVFFAALRMEIAPRRYREPDLLLLRDAKDRRNQERYWTGADLVLEVVSPDGSDRDLVTKRADYAAAGIPEYWIVNPLDETITVLRLEGGAYVAHGVFRRGERATSALLSGFAVAVAAVFDAD